MLLGILGKFRWSFTVHGPEEFDKAPLIKLAEKTTRQRFRRCDQLLRPRADCIDWSNNHIGKKSKSSAADSTKNFFRWSPAGQASANKLVCVGRICEQKGQLLLIEAMARLVKIRPDATVGPCRRWRNSRGQSKVEIARHNLERDTFISPVGSAMRPFATKFSKPGRSCLPSLAEGLPVVIMEAMALRRPIISTFVAGIPELVVSRRTWLVGPRRRNRNIGRRDRSTVSTHPQTSSRGWAMRRAHAYSHDTMLSTKRRQS